MTSAKFASASSPAAHLTELLCSPRIAYGAAAALILSGCVHLAIFVMLGLTWHGPLSIRKPVLFGISSGLTTWSLAWLTTKLRPQKNDPWLLNAMSIGLLIEVGLITAQYWRGVASHFNRTTFVDAAIEISMVGLILFVSAGIFYLTARTIWLREMQPEMAIAIRGGMGLLALSCVLGIATSVLGEMSLAAGRSHEIWGAAGVLKFPHGVALHAIQILPMIAWLASPRRRPNAVRIIHSALAAQILFLGYAVWQTSQGLDRFEWNTIGTSILALALVVGIYPVLAIVRRP